MPHTVVGTPVADEIILEAVGMIVTSGSPVISTACGLNARPKKVPKASLMELLIIQIHFDVSVRKYYAEKRWVF